jgi:ADP-heptose:LPS heptosyltransferase
VVADLHNVLRSKVVRTLFALSGKNVAATDKGRAEKKVLTSLTNKVFAPVKPMFERHVDTFKQLGFSINLTNVQFPEKATLSEEILSITGIKNQNWIGIAPFAQYESKVYPQDLMQQVIDELAENKNHKIFLFGGGDKEIQLLNQLQSQHENILVLAGKLKFKHELDVISNLDIMLSMDSGNAHIAAMLGVKVITLWGATHPYAGFKPFNQPDTFCLTSDREKYPLLPTSIYGNKKVEGYEDMMRTILPTQVIEKINSNLT